MDDEKIISLYWERSETALSETRTKYSAYLFAIAYRVLNLREDAEECENDTYLAAWDAIPPVRPTVLSAFLGKITRNLSLKRLRARTADKRGGGEATLSLDELGDCLPDGGAFPDTLEAQELADRIDAFLRTLPQTERRVFLCRYWYCDSILDIAGRFGYGESKVKMMLSRTRAKLLTYLTKEGIFV